MYSVIHQIFQFTSIKVFITTVHTARADWCRWKKHNIIEYGFVTEIFTKT